MRIIAILMSILVVSLPVALASELNLIYDQNGNLVTGDSLYREYNQLNQLVTIKEGNTSTGNVINKFVYHPVEERVLIKDIYYNGIYNSSIYYVSEEFVRIENSSGNYTEKYVYQDNILVAQQDTDNNKQAVHPDMLGSVHTLTDSSGSVLDVHFTSPYGEPISDNKGSRYSYEAKEYDEATKQIDFHFRMYRPEFGRFLQPDSLIEHIYNPQDLNHYTFERNNPYRNTDEEGHLLGLIAGGIFAIAAAIATVIILIDEAEEQDSIGLASTGASEVAPIVIEEIAPKVAGKVNPVFGAADIGEALIITYDDFREEEEEEDKDEFYPLCETCEPPEEDLNQITDLIKKVVEKASEFLNGGGGGGGGGSSGGNPGYWYDCTESCSETCDPDTGVCVKSCTWVCTRK